MNNSIVSGAYRTARTTISICVFSIATLLIAFVGQRLLFEQAFRAASELSASAMSAAADIILADERLTMSANMAAQTGERRWIDRYNSYIPEIDNAIKIATAIASPQVAELLERETKLANDMLVEMERRSFVAVQEGDLARAKMILDSEAYLQEKNILKDGSNRFLNSVIDATRNRMETVQFLGNVALLTLLSISILAGGLFWALTSRRINASETSNLIAEDKLNFMARHDELTSLPNRGTFIELLTVFLEKQRRVSDGLVAVAMVDIDHFKDINDTLGHKFGDELIRLVPERFRLGLPNGAVLARFGGDEFAIALAVKSGKEAREDFKKLVHCFSEPLDINGHLLSITISVGVALSPTDAKMPDELLRFADIALYEAKTQGRNRMHMFVPLLDERKRERMQTESYLRVALENDEFELYYQPLFSPDGKTVTELEALIRWHHPGRGTISPAHFIPIAEQSGLIVPIGTWVIKRAFEDSLRWPQLRIAINISPAQLREPSFFGSLQRLVLSTEVDPRRFDLEITEGVLLENNRRVHRLLNDLHGLGFGISLDDFGTGYSSLSYLRSYPFTNLKIDRSFIKSIDTSTQAAQIVHSIISLGRALGLSVTAEGVETIGQHQFLEAAGCQKMQGFLFGGAQSPGEIDHLLATQEQTPISMKIDIC
ncbi:putative bifunctional diguanylate cyclase/phosphodiesterase [Pseudomonas sp. NPDC087342]|uniref:putative bifunctional diguanylate cyclase/phosphodiesterase n=1 Tax=Pseudomonas sp. NPDC087342 TaxID=3364437 RepID=UPI00382C03D4